MMVYIDNQAKLLKMKHGEELLTRPTLLFHIALLFSMPQFDDRAPQQQQHGGNVLFI